VTSATEPAKTLSELAAYLSVSTQALYDLRSKGRGPSGPPSLATYKSAGVRPAGVPSEP